MTTIVSKIALMYFVMLQIGVYVSLIVGIILLGVFLIVRGTKVILKDETINSKAKQRCSMTCTVSGIILGLAPVQSYPNEYIRIASIIISVLLIALLVRLNFRYKESVKVFLAEISWVAGISILVVFVYDIASIVLSFMYNL